MSARHGARDVQSTRSAGSRIQGLVSSARSERRRSTLSQLRLGGQDEGPQRKVVYEDGRKRRPSDPDWEGESPPRHRGRPPANAKPRPATRKVKGPSNGTRSAKQKEEKIRMREIKRAKNRQSSNGTENKVRPDVKQARAPPQPRRDFLEEAVQERLKLETEAAALQMELPLSKRPRLAARPHALRRLVTKLTEEEELPPPTDDMEQDPGDDLVFQLEQILDPDPDLGGGPDPGSESTTAPGLETEQTPEPGQPEEAELDQPEEEGQDQLKEEERSELSAASGQPEDGPRPTDHGADPPQYEPTKQAPAGDAAREMSVHAGSASVSSVKKPPAARADPGTARAASVTAPAAAGSPKTATVSTGRKKAETEAAPAGTKSEPKTEAAGTEADSMTIEIDPDALLLKEASDEEACLVSSMLLSVPNRRTRCTVRTKTLQCRGRQVYRACAEYLDLAEPTDPGPVAADPPGSRGQRLTVLRPPPAETPAQLAARLQEQSRFIADTLLPPATMMQALDLIQQLRLQNLHLQAALLRAGTEPLRGVPEAQAEPGRLPTLRRGRGSHKELAAVHATRLRRLERIEEGVERSFSKAQIAVLCGEDHRSSAHWSEEDLRRAVELRTLGSRKVFEFVRDSLGMPLPTISTMTLKCKRYPHLDEALQRALGAPGPRCPTCRRNRDDATTEEERRSYDPKPRPPRKPRTPVIGMKAKQAAGEEGEATKKRVKKTAALARRTGEPLGLSPEKASPKKRTSWSFQETESAKPPKVKVKPPPPRPEELQWHGVGTEPESQEQWEGGVTEPALELSVPQDDSSSSSSSEEDSEDGEDAELDLNECYAVTEMRKKLARRGMWMS